MRVSTLIVWRICALFFAGIILAGLPVQAQSITVDDVSGGGAICAASGVALNGSVQAFGAVSGTGTATDGSTIHPIGFFHALVASFPTTNAAHPVWLEVVLRSQDWTGYLASVFESWSG